MPFLLISIQLKSFLRRYWPDKRLKSRTSGILYNKESRSFITLKLILTCFAPRKRDASPFAVSLIKIDIKKLISSVVNGEHSSVRSLQINTVFDGFPACLFNERARYYILIQIEPNYNQIRAAALILYYV